MVSQMDRTGFRDWLIQRISAVIIGLFAIFIVIYLLKYQPLYYAQWSLLFSHLWMKMITFIVVVSVLWHAWLGLWTVFTDYVKPTAVRVTLEIIILLLIGAYFVWTIEILWG